jgi:hypothetical protein
MAIRLAYYTAEAAVTAMPYFDSSVELIKETRDKGKEVYFIVAYQEKVVGIDRIVNGDFTEYWAVVFDEYVNTFRQIKYATTAYRCDDHSASVDAPAELIQKHMDYNFYVENQTRAISDARELDIIKKGNWVEVVRGKKVPTGMTGLVFWMGSDSWGTKKLGISPSGVKVNNKYEDTVWIASSFCKVIPKPDKKTE